MTGWVRSTGEWMKEHPRFTKAIGFTVAALAGLLVVGGGLLAFMGTAIALAAPLRFGLFMMGMSARTGAGRIGLIGRAIRMLNPIRWAMLIPKLAWRLFVTPLKWLSFLPNIAWRGIVGGFRWLSFLPRLSWRLLIPALKWGSRLIPGIGWAVLAGELAWHLLVKPLGWDRYLPGIEWSKVFGAFSWDGWIPKVDWGMLLGAVKWPVELTSFDWRKFVKEINWLKIMGMGIPTAINSVIEKFTGIDLMDKGAAAIATWWAGTKASIGQKAEGFKARLKSLVSVDWRSAIGNIDWPNILLFGLPGAVGEVVKAFTGIDLFEMGANAIKSLWNGMSSMVGQMVEDIKSNLTGMLPDWATKYLGIGGGDEKAGGNVQARASGGSYRSGPLLVGERGPELKYASEGGYIAHNDNLKRMVRMSDRIRRAARIGAVAGAVAAPMPSVATAAPILPALPAQAAPAAAATRPQFEISIQIGSITANDPDIANVVEEAVTNALNRAMTDAQNLLSD